MQPKNRKSAQKNERFSKTQNILPIKKHKVYPNMFKKRG